MESILVDGEKQPPQNLKFKSLLNKKWNEKYIATCDIRMVVS
jgi:hypothetical protein